MVSAWPSAFVYTITVIVFCGSDPKMIWIDTKLNVAGMANKFSRGYFSFMDLIRKAMGFHVDGMAKTKNSVPVWKLRSCPDPARTCFIDTFKKSCFRINSFPESPSGFLALRNIGAGFRAVFSSAYV